MNNKILFGIMAIIMGIFFVGCSDEDDYSISTGALISDQNVTTGSADVTPTSAILYGSVSGLDSQSASAYTTGFEYGSAEESLTERVSASGSADGFTATVSGFVGDVIYYRAYVTLQGKLTYRGGVKSLVLTDAKAATGEVKSVEMNTATLAIALTDAPDDAEAGVLISGSADEEVIRASVRVAATAITAGEVTVTGLLPGTTYHYAAYLDLGAGLVYGDVKSFTTQEQVFDVDNDLVDLGLSTKWAKYNIGASKENEPGGLFGFGDMKGFNSSIVTTDYATANIYKTASDLAYATYQGKAMLPTADEYEELFRCCEVEWTELEGVAGYKFTGPNGNSIFMPAAGSRVALNTSGIGKMGCYMTGSISNDAEYAYNYQFTSANNGRNNVPVYTAMSVRAVSNAKNVPFDVTKLYQKWYIDNGQDGKQHVFEGPFTQYGAHDTYGTITNGEPNIYESIHWEMGTNNGWIGYTYGKDYGYMEFLETGDVKIHRIAEDGTVTDETAKFTIDTENKTITIDKDVLAANTWLPTKQGTLNILSLTGEQLQIALPAGDDTYAYALNYYSEAKRLADEEIVVQLGCVDPDWQGTWDYVGNRIAPADLNGQHTLTYEASLSSAMIVYLDFIDLTKRFPNAMIRIDDIKCDGNSIKFDANKFFYGDIEGNGKYRIELFNIYGKGSANGNVIESPFSTATNVNSEPAFSFTSKLEIVYTIFTDFNGAFTPNLITINPSWGGPWAFNQGAMMNVSLVENKYVMDVTAFDITYTPDGTDHSAGSIMTFIEVGGLFNYFPGTHATLDALLLDGVEQSFDVTKVVDTSDSGNYRLELWNCYGATKGNCAFGEAEGDVMKSLAFGNSMQLKFTFHNLYSVPEW